MRVNLLQWSAWAPGISSRKEWIAYFQGHRAISRKESPEVSRIDPLLRRRMSLLSRMTVAAALDCCERAAVSPANARVVFASRHGEMQATADLLGQMLAKEPVSPMGFSGSVHHTAPSYFSMVTRNREPMRAVSGGDASLCYGFLEAAGMVEESATSPVLLVAADDALPSPFESFDKAAFPYAIAFLLGRSGRRDVHALSLTLEGAADRAKQKRMPALDVLRWLITGDTSMKQILSGRVWRWEK